MSNLIAAGAASPFNNQGIQYAWDSTSLKLAETCLYKYYLKMKCGWQPERKSVHLLFGGWYATALEHFHAAIAAGVDREQAVCDVVHEALIDTWEYEDCETCQGTGTTMVMACYGGKPTETTGECPDCEGTGNSGGQPWTSDHNTKTRENLIRTIIWYLDHFIDDNCKTVILSDGSAAVEHSFKLPVDNGIIFCGHLDRVVDYANNVYIQDQKTTQATISSRYFDGYNPDTQMSMYTFAGKAIFGLPVKGIMIDAASIMVGFTRFERGFTFRDDGQLQEWYDSAMRLITRVQEAEAEQYFPQNPSSCGNFGGCEFRNACSKSPKIRDNFLKADFKQGEIWNPLRSR